jgi:dienelactone hydrolase
MPFTGIRRAVLAHARPAGPGGALSRGFWAVWIVLAVTAAAEADTLAVTFRTPDGRTVSAVLHEAGSRPAPAVVLVPMLGRTKEDWQEPAERLADAGISALAIDLPAPAAPASAAALTAWHRDVVAAVAWLSSRPDVRAAAIGVAGASLGANLAAVAAAADARVRALALVSPSLDYRGVRIEAALRQYGTRPAFLAASLRDPYAARSVRQLAEDPPGLREVYWAEAAAHGSALLAGDPEAVRRLVEWFQRTLG